MTVKIRKKKPSKIARKIKTIPAGSKKKINWDKYVGKIDFPIDALTYQQKLRDEWAE